MRNLRVPESIKSEIMQQGQDINFNLSDLKLWSLSSVLHWLLSNDWVSPAYDYWGVPTLLVFPILTATETQCGHTLSALECVSVGSFFAFGNIFISLALLEWDDNFWICSFIVQMKERREKAAACTDGAGGAFEVPWSMKLSLLAAIKMARYL